ncbi:ABC transporter ATP-binding protein [Kamptonema cortianum]|nr:ABC transporter ATP-binding protein [Geitlerinema splendidum]MDK3162272.1 ABC transporter ATP-binding protein [Kamptonema cortianum]
MTQSLLKVDKLEVRYDGGFELGPISFDVPAGEIHAILGENGSGKTTIIKAICNEVTYTGGIQLAEREIAQLSPKERAQSLSLVPQIEPIAFGFTVEEVVLMARIPWNSGLWENSEDRKLAEQAMDTCDVLKLRHRRLNELSGGQRQRCLIARAIAQNPKVLLLDEPTVYLDAKVRQSLGKLIARLANQGLAILLTSHDIQWVADLANSVTLLQEGKPVGSGILSESMTPEKLNQVFGVRFQRLDQDGRLIFLADA